MKKSVRFILLVIAWLAVPTLVLAQTKPCKRNDNAATTLQGTNLQDAPCGVTSKGELFINRIASPVPVVPQAGTPQPTPVPAQITPSAVTRILATAVPTAFPTPQATTAGNAKFMESCNGTNQEVVGAFGGATVQHFSIDPGACYWRDWAANGTTYNGPVSIARPGTLQTSGEVKIWFEY